MPDSGARLPTLEHVLPRLQVQQHGLQSLLRSSPKSHLARFLNVWATPRDVSSGGEDFPCDPFAEPPEQWDRELEDDLDLRSAFPRQFNWRGDSGSEVLSGVGFLFLFERGQKADWNLLRLSVPQMPPVKPLPPRNPSCFRPRPAPDQNLTRKKGVNRWDWGGGVGSPRATVAAVSSLRAPPLGINCG